MSSRSGSESEDSSPSPSRKKMKIEDEDEGSQESVRQSEQLSSSESVPNPDSDSDMDGSHDEVDFQAVVEKLEEMHRHFSWTAEDWENILEAIENYSLTSKKNENGMQSEEEPDEQDSDSCTNNGVLGPSTTSGFFASIKPITCSDNHDTCPFPTPEEHSPDLSTANVVAVLDSIKNFLISEDYIRFLESQASEGEDVVDKRLPDNIMKEVLDFIEKVSLKEVNTLHLNSVKKKVNPLCNDLILSNIMEYLDLEDLKNCRLVSKFWNRMATPEFKKSHGRIDLCCDTHLQRFCRDMEKTLQFPFGYFKFRPTRVVRENMCMFFTQFGSFVEHVYLKGESNDITLQELNHFKESLRFILHYLPNVVEVELADLPREMVSRGFTLTRPREPPILLPKVNALRISTNYRDAYEKEFITDLFKLMPNVRKLGLGVPECRSSKQFIFVPPNLKLTSLQIGYEDSWTITSVRMIQHLASHPFSFESLTFNINFGSPMEAVILEKFLKRQRNCLKVLNLWSTMDNTTRFGFPVMEKLEYLSVYFDDAVDSADLEDDNFVPRMLCHPFTSHQLPVLRILDINIWCLSVLFPAANNGSFPTVKSIKIDYTARDYIKNSNYLNYFGSISVVFPKLTTFIIISADFGAIAEIFRSLQFLEELEFEYSENSKSDNINSVLCGFPTSTEWISKKFDEWRRTRTHAEFETMLELFTDPPHHCLLDMKRLKKLRILGPDRELHDAEVITDVSVYLAFLRMQRLDQLVLDRNETLSEEGVAALEEYHTNVTIIREPEESNPP